MTSFHFFLLSNSPLPLWSVEIGMTPSSTLEWILQEGNSFGKPFIFATLEDLANQTKLGILPLFHSTLLFCVLFSLTPTLTHQETSNSFM